MKISVERQTPAVALTTLIVIVAASYVRFVAAPFGNELFGSGTMPLLADYLSALSASHRVASVVAAALMTIVAGMLIGQMGSRFRLYPVQTFLSMPIFGFVACGIFISSDVLSSSLTLLLAAMSLKYICRGYLRERDLSAMLYAGLCIGCMLMVSIWGAVYVAAAVSAIFIFSLSARELLVLVLSVLFPPLVCCYAVWALGGDFLLPLLRFREALFAESGVETFGHDAVCALLLCGVAGFTFVCSTVHFLANRFMVSVKSRGILIYNVVLSLYSVAMFALPSSTPADFGVAAVPMSTLMPVLFIREGERLSVILYLSLWVAFILHLLYY